MTGADSRAVRVTLIGVPYLWLALFVVLPFAIVAAISLGESAVGVPPYTLGLGGANFALIAEDDLYRRAYFNSLILAGIATLLCLLAGYPIAYAIARAPRRWRNLLLMLVILPFWTSFLIRVYAWTALLRPNGLVNNLLAGLGLIAEPLPLIDNAFAVIVALVYSYLPFMILPLYATLERMDGALLEAAADLGARPVRTFLAITLPLSLPGIVAGSLLVFIPAVGEFVIPDLLGGPGTPMVGKVLWDEFFINRDWPVAAALAVAMLAILAAPIVFARRLLAGNAA